MRRRLEEERAGLALAAEQCAAELERSAAAERAGWDALEAAEAAFREALAAVAEIEAQLGQLADGARREIEQRRGELDAAERAGAGRPGASSASAPEAAGDQALAQAEAALAEAERCGRGGRTQRCALAERTHLTGAAARAGGAERAERRRGARRSISPALEQRMAAAQGGEPGRPRPRRPRCASGQPRRTRAAREGRGARCAISRRWSSACAPRPMRSPRWPSRRPPAPA